MAGSGREPEEFLEAADQTDGGLMRELWLFLKHSRKWWLLPMIVVFLLVGLLVVMGSTGGAPFIYTFF